MGMRRVICISVCLLLTCKTLEHKHNEVVESFSSDVD